MNVHPCAQDLAEQLRELFARGAKELHAAEGASPEAWAAETAEAIARALAGNRDDLYRASVLACVASLDRHGLVSASPASVARAVHGEVLDATSSLPAGHPLGSACVMVRGVILDLEHLESDEGEGEHSADDVALTEEEPAPAPGRRRGKRS